MLYLLLIFGVFCCSTSVIWIRASSLEPQVLAAARLLLAAGLLVPVWLRVRRQHPEVTLAPRILGPAAILLSLHFISWAAGARMTPAANASLLVNLAPVAMPIFCFWFLRELPSPNQWVGTGLALTGVVLLGWADFKTSPDYLLGDLVCLTSMCFYAAYLTWGRRQRQLPSVWLYIVPVYALSGLLCLLTTLVDFRQLWRPLFTGSSAREEWLWLLGLTVVPTILGHSILNASVRRMPGQVVAVINVFQFAFAGFLGWFLLAEEPGLFFLPAAMLAASGAACVILEKPKVKQTT